MASNIPRPVLTHAQRVCRLYKKVLKEQANYTVLRHEKRFEAVLMRARFDATRECKDMRKCAAMLEVAEDMLFECQHLYPFKYKFDEGGIMFARVHNFPDYLHDIWHPWEVALYPDVFEKRQAMKKKYEEYYEKSLKFKFMGPPPKPTSEKVEIDYPIISPEVAALK